MKYLIVFACFAQLCSAEPLPFYENKDMTPYWPDTPSSTHFQPARVTGFKALDQNGKDFDLEQMKGHVSLVNFFFVQCPGVCPAMMKSVQKIQKSLVKEISNIQVLSFSVMPEKDTPARLTEYSKTYGIDSKNWKLLTGDKMSIYKVGKDMFKADGAVGKQKNESSFVHTQNIYLVDKDLFIRGLYNTSDEQEMKNLAADIHRL